MELLTSMGLSLKRSEVGCYCADYDGNDPALCAICNINRSHHVNCINCLLDKQLVQYPAIFSPNRIYRYTLSRVANTEGVGTCAWIMLNPSTADEYKLDPTLTRCFNYTAEWGYKYMLVGNIFAYRATDPADMKAMDMPIGLWNDAFLLEITSQADKVICGWGTNEHPGFIDRGLDVRKSISAVRELDYLQLTKEGYPSHPLYLKKSLTPTLWEVDNDWNNA